ncbi:heparan-alpha-glucosaminide N-acetyltransferase domain-containing protein [Actinorugispora endophytica]|uniref:Putative membrane protein n=1 Tax=Actinorugispora endophytica TaxID=1605990 RepID=A0A4R6UNT2_9ACTN|nr:heparan-alpha-glucosaminide N-acetyltransferase domain-containing protein [Actinorugispora endophytica]TDQ48818.1 putative membrane protein [Actinorugispora endophytica]
MSRLAPETRTQRSAWPEPGRLVGVDVARSIAVFGMFTVHLGVGSIGLLDGPAAEAFHELARGRSSALFAFLAGVSLALLSGGAHPSSDASRRRVGVKIAVRAMALTLLGMFLDLLGAPIAIILVYYAGYFLLALPLLRLGAGALAGIAAAIALLGPQLSFLIRSLIGDPGAPAASIDGLGDFFLSGYYPACTFMAFVVAGMAVGRLDLRSAPARAGLAGTGLVLAALGYGGSWLLMHPLGGVDRLTRTLAAQYYGTAAETAPAEDLLLLGDLTLEEIASLHGTVPTDSPFWLLVASPHSGTTFEIAGAVGTALVVLAACLFLADLLHRGVFPLAAAGSMVLTVYVGHVVVIAMLGGSSYDFSPFRLELFVLGALLFATLWKLLLGRGPLERLLGWSADGATRLALSGASPARRP